MNKFEIIFVLIKIPLDFLAVFLSAIIAYLIRPVATIIPFSQEQLISFNAFLLFAFFASLTFILFWLLNEIYSLEKFKWRLKEIFKIILNIIFLNFSIISFYALFKVETFFSRWILLIMSVLSIILIILIRSIIYKIQNKFLKKWIWLRKVALFWNKTSGVPSSSTYRGESAFSEPETETVRQYCIKHNFRLALNYHSYSNLLITPWGYIPEATPDSLFYNSIASDMTQYNNYKWGYSALGQIYNSIKDPKRKSQRLTINCL